jgi:hypothetical protein
VAISAWSPDGRSISFASDSGIRVLELASGRQRLVALASGGNWTAWSDDSRTIYWGDNDSLQRFMIRAIPLSGGAPRTLVYANAPDQQLHRFGLSVSKGRFYFPLVDRKADVWVAEVERK